MTRQARGISETGYYHVIQRGVGKQIIFEEISDYKRYISLLKRISGETGVKVCAYCLMSNHVHLLLYDPGRNMSKMMSRVGICYSGYYNQKYERVGHLFQDRFLSEPIGTDGQLMVVFRYILNNPYKAGICEAEKYRWSSYHDYGKGGAFADTSAMEGLIGGWSDYRRFIDQTNDDKCMEYWRPRYNDENARKLIRTLFDVNSGTSIREFDKDGRDVAVCRLRLSGLTIRQIARLTGISKATIERIVKARSSGNLQNEYKRTVPPSSCK